MFNTESDSVSDRSVRSQTYASAAMVCRQGLAMCGSSIHGVICETAAAEHAPRRSRIRPESRAGIGVATVRGGPIKTPFPDIADHVM